ncbi:sugar transferase [Rosistilla oblonga]|uniref:sugar transferase n=1 Tax=Rosistilla oblonga TaxID=2527990 RepID=UPI003A979B11
MKRAFDVCAAAAGLICIGPLMFSIAVLVRLTSRGNAIHWSKRVGARNILFAMPKFRTMYQDTPQLATHLLQDANSHITPLGRILRKTSLDELPQLWSVLVGDMSFVGPRPALYNQHDLVELRTKTEVHQLAPGITGWAQINGRDELSVSDKVDFDVEYLRRQSFYFDLKILVLTLVKVVRRDGICQAETPQTVALSLPSVDTQSNRAA